VLARGLAKQPEQRPATCVELVSELARAWNIRRSDSLDPDATVLAPWNKNTPSNSTAFAQQDMATVPQTSATTLNQYNSAAGAPFMGANGPWGGTTNATSSMQGVQPQVQGMLPDGQPGQFIQPPEQPKKKGISRRALIVGGATVGTLAVLGVAGGVGIPMLLNEQKKLNTQGGQRPKGPHKLVEGTAVFLLQSHTQPVFDSAWDPQGRYLLTAGEDNTVYMWDIAGAANQRTAKAARQTLSTPFNTWKFQEMFWFNQISWSPDGKSILMVPEATNTIYVANALQKNSNPQEYYQFGSSGDQQYRTRIYSLGAWKPGSNDTFATNLYPFYDPGCVQIWKLSEHNKPVKTFSFSTDSNITKRGIYALGWSLTGKYLAGFNVQGHIVIWNPDTGKIIKTLAVPYRKQNPYVNDDRIDITWSPIDKDKLMTIDSDAGVVFDVAQNKVLFSFGTDDPRPHNPPDINKRKGWIARLTGVAWSPNGQYIAGCFSNDNRVYIWDAQVQSNSRVKDGLRMPIMQFGDVQGHDKLATINVSWSPDGKYIVTTSYDNTAIVWQVDADA
jgi:WD40 repeat protein